MNMKKLFQNIGILAVILGGLGYFAYRTFTKVWVEKTTLKNLRPTWDALTGTVIIKVKNQSQTALSIQGFQGEILYNNIGVADLLVGPSVIAAQTTTEIPVNFRALYTELPISIEQIFKQQAWYPQFSVAGTLYAANLKIPIQQQLQIV